MAPCYDPPPTVPIDYFGQKESRKCSVDKSMGKSRKFSKGQAAGFIPNYHHAVETMAESEGLGSSGRIDAEMTASEDSFAPKRKSISLNVGGYDSYDVPMQALCLAKMSKPERKSLEFRLMKELEQVRVLQRRLDSFSSNPVVLSPSNDIRSSSNGQKRPPHEGVHIPVQVTEPNAKKRGPPNRGGSRGKKGRVEQSKAAVASSMSTSMLMKQCEVLLSRLMSQQFSWIFNTPVDAVQLKIPDYYTIIKQPMDLGTVKTKLTSGQYSSPLEFAADVRLTFENAKKYNPPGNEVHYMADMLSKFFEVRWKAIEKKLPLIIDTETVHSGAGPSIEVETSTDAIPSKKKIMMPSETSTKIEPVKQTITDGFKQKLSTDLMDCIGDLPVPIVEFLKEHCPPDDQTGEDEIELDIDALTDDTLLKLRKMLDDHLLDKQKKHGSADSCQMELLNESGFSYSSMQPCKGNEAVEEEVDVVGGNDPPASTFPPIEIEKDATKKQSRCGSSSSSSSDYDSSDAEVIGHPDAAMKNAGENLDEKRNGDGVSDIGGSQPELVTSMVEDDQNVAQDKPTVDEGLPYSQEGEIAPPEKQVSPDKAYRAAILRSRFADTILKAREKALEKGEKRDPETLRIEREELEQRQREEKARLQAEAKVAEEARRKAEAEAAAEARRKRELEREAARQALLQMEKTVDIIGNSMLMEDLEMLRTSTNEQGQSFEEGVIPDPLQNGLGSFKLQGSGGNPLELLGLYMKDEDEDDEEIELQKTVPEEPANDPGKDVEEGEID